MSLRSKLALGFGGLALLALALGVAGVVLLGRLGPAIDVVLFENQRSVLAMQRAKEGLERQDSGALFALLGETGQARALAETYDPVVREAIALELGNLTVPGERERAERLAAAYEQYRAAYPAVLDEAAPPGDRQRAYFGTLLPAFHAAKTEADSILAMNQREIVRANAEARSLAADGRALMLALLAGAVLLAGLLVWLVERLVARPVRRLTEGVREAQGGNLDVVVPVETADEIGLLGAAFNDLTASLREVRRTDAARVLRAQHATQAAVDALPDAVALLDPGGTVELANRTARRLFGLEPGVAVADALPAAAEIVARPDRAVERRPTADFAGVLQAFDDGAERFFRPQAVAVRDARRDLAGVLLVLDDVTDLRASSELRRDWRARTAHELGSPVTSLRLALHLLLEDRDGTLSPGQTELLLAAREDAEAVARVTDALGAEPSAPSASAPLYTPTDSPAPR